MSEENEKLEAADGAVVEIPDDELPPGAILGSYRILELLGEGGMGRVYLAEHVRLGRRIALKVLRAEFVGNPTAVKRFFAEARAVNRISHEHLIEITDFFENENGANYYVMELLKGQDLAMVLLANKHLPLIRTIDICSQVAHTLEAVHAAGIVHRDVKPDNIFLTNRAKRADFVKLLDFGVAKLREDPQSTGIQLGKTAQGTIIGTPEYMSPEQAGGQDVDHRADIYALGVVMYEMLTGKVPFRGKSFGEMVVKVMTMAPVPPSRCPEVPFPIPASLDELVLQLLAKDASDRPQTMGEVEERLRAISDEIAPVVELEVDNSAQHRASVRIPAVPMRASGPVPIIRPPSKPGDELERGPTLPGTSGSMPAMSGSGPVMVVKPPSGEIPPLPNRPMMSSSQIPRVGKPASGELPPIPGSALDTVSLFDMPAAKPKRWPLVVGAGAIAVAAVALGMIAMSSGSKTAPTAAAPPPVASAPVEPATISVRFESTPSGATVRAAGESAVLGTTPFTLTIERAHMNRTFAFELAGHTGTTQEIALAHDATVAVALAPLPPPPPVTPPPPVAGKPATPVVKPVKPPPQQQPKKQPTDRNATMDVFGN